jgi:hypothetical protein
MNNEAFWMVWNENGRAPTFKHPSHASANTEAERLAKLIPGERFVVLQAVGAVRVQNPVEWTELIEIPF